MKNLLEINTIPCLELVEDDTVAALYVERCQILISGGWNTETWDGVNRMETK